MQIYLVGGAIRDELLGRHVSERDWVVVGASPEELLAEGFQPVGKEFPVFLHPETHEEYALARTERKVGKGYKGFTFYAAPDVTLEQDLIRRDLTINAMARDHDGKLVDPHGGCQDLKKRLLHHVSEAFAEDPVRILRTARFAARFGDFNVHPDTNQLMQKMVKAGEVDALVSERVWKELSRALNESHPERFFEVLNDCGALAILFPDINVDGDGMRGLSHAVTLEHGGIIRFAVLLHDLSVAIIKQLCARYRVPREYAQMALLVAQYLPSYRHVLTTHAEHILILLKNVDAIRREQRFEEFLKAVAICSDQDNDAIAKHLRDALIAVKKVDITPLQEKNLKGKSFAKALHQLRVEAIARLTQP